MNDHAAAQGLARALADPALFSAHVLARPLRAYQAAVARAILQSIEERAGRQFTVLFPRQAGKNELSAHLEALLLARYQLVGAALVKAAPTFKPQTLNSLSRLAGLLDNPLTRGRWTRSHGYVVRLGKATATFFSAEPSTSVVGATADVLLECDEAQDVHDRKWDKDFRPMAAVGNATTVYYGTSWREDDLLARAIAEAKVAEAQDGIRRHFEIGWEEVAAANPLYGQHVQGEIARLGEHHPIVQTQYLLHSLARAGRFLSPEQLTALLGDHPPESVPLGPGPYPSASSGQAHYVAAIDVAGADEEDPEGQLARVNPKRDSTVLIIARVEEARVAATAPLPTGNLGHAPTLGEGPDSLSLWERAGVRVDREPRLPPGQPLPPSALQPAWAVLEPRLHVVHIRAWTGTPHRQIYPQILDLVRSTWRCRHVVVDANGVGGGLAAFLGAALGPRVVTPYLYTTQTKSDLAYGLIEALNSRRLTLYAESAHYSAVPHSAAAPSFASVANEARRELLHQCTAAEYELRAHQAMTFFVPEHHGHDDHLNALALLVQATKVAALRSAVGSRPSVTTHEPFPFASRL